KGSALSSSAHGSRCGAQSGEGVARRMDCLRSRRSPAPGGHRLPLLRSAVAGNRHQGFTTARERGGREVRRHVVMLALVGAALVLLVVSTTATSSDEPIVVIRDAASGKLQPAQLTTQVTNHGRTTTVT